MNVLNINSEPLVSIAIKNILLSNYENTEVYTSCNYDEIITLSEQLSFDLILLDIGTPSMDTFKLMKTLSTLQEDANALVFSRHEYKPYAVKYIHAGASGFLEKSSSEEDFLLAVKLVTSGQLYLSKDTLMSIYNDNVNRKNGTTPFENLSARELEVFKLLIKGKRIKDISKTMKIHQSTTSTLKKRILRKFKVDNMMKLKSMATEYGY